MTGAEGKLFRPLAFTKTFALLASIIVALTIIPPAAHILFTRRCAWSRGKRHMLAAILLGLAVAAGILVGWWLGAIVAAVGLYHLTRDRLPAKARNAMPLLANAWP
jgi:Cu(I)/Ag(I) efflux system membrane protein CusA/SilA